MANQSPRPLHNTLTQLLSFARFILMHALDPTWIGISRRLQNPARPMLDHFHAQVSRTSQYCKTRPPSKISSVAAAKHQRLTISNSSIGGKIVRQ
jgi:hypothetical protein